AQRRNYRPWLNGNPDRGLKRICKQLPGYSVTFAMKIWEAGFPDLLFERDQFPQQSCNRH
ncbi:MAG TPA: hypothetical protein PLN56_10310, partial [Methanoregulaceae archaeon]|nr:hypothetical protein [Methanoregulaceae archaeon]